MRAAAWPTKRPANSAVAHDARHILSDMPLHHRTPRNQREVARPLDQGLPQTRHIDRTGQATLYRLLHLLFEEGLDNFVRSPERDPQQFARLTGRNHEEPSHRTATSHLGKLTGAQRVPTYGR